jgi:uncharacterized protein with gpF-like domain
LDNITIGRQFNTASLYAFILGTKDETTDAAAIFNIDTENEKMTETATPFVEKQIAEQGAATVDEVGMDMTFRLDIPEVQQAITQQVNRFKDINDTTYSKIKEVLRGVYDEGVGLDEAARRLRETYKQFNKTRALTVARTEMNGMVNGGKFLGYSQAGVSHLEWRSAFLTTSRQAHMDADGQVVRNGEYFRVGRSLMKYPSDPNGHAGDTINCYCTIMGFYKDE